eukprot:9635374-Lingulodinium_polyedra.AAC.1
MLIYPNSPHKVLTETSREVFVRICWVNQACSSLNKLEQLLCSPTARQQRGSASDVEQTAPSIAS